MQTNRDAPHPIRSLEPRPLLQPGAEYLVSFVMDATEIRWYSLKRNLDIDTHETVDLQAALEIVERYWDQCGALFPSPEEGLAATLFGFNRGSSASIEFCIKDPTFILCTLRLVDPEASWLRNFLHGPLRHDMELRSREELLYYVEIFFNTSPCELKRHMEEANPSHPQP